MADKMNLFQMASLQFEAGADLCKLDPMVRTILAEPQNEIIVNFPVQMDDGRYRLFKGYRIQHNNVNGPYKGGIRYNKAVNLSEVKALAAWMTWKSVLMGIPFGGGKGGVTLTPRNYSEAELCRVTRRFTHALGNNIGPEYDIPAPDMGTGPREMVWMMDTYMSTFNAHDRMGTRRVVTGKSILNGGSLGRDKATGQGLVFCLETYGEHFGFDIDGMDYVVQGFGNVGSHTAMILQEKGARLLAVHDHTGSIASGEGIDAQDLAQHVRDTGGVRGYKGAGEISVEDFYSTKCHVFIPAALECTVNTSTEHLIKAKYIIEGANGPTTLAAETKLRERGITVIPDILANSGGVTVSYFEWVQNKNSEVWDLERVDEGLRKIIHKATIRVIEESKRYNCEPRRAAMVIALARLDRIYKERGIFP